MNNQTLSREFTPDQIKQLTEIKSYAIKKAPIATNKIFPVLLFSPGFGYPAQTGQF